MMGCFLVGSAIWFLGYGLWQHDWRIILVSVLLAVIWPLIQDQVVSVAEERRHQQVLDRLWDDDDLSDSA
jgi:hypothetical protein